MIAKQSYYKYSQNLSASKVADGRQSGFTLIEIMMVIAINGILAAIATVSYQTQVRQAHIMTAYHEINLFRLPYHTLVNEGASLPTVVFVK